MNTLTAYSVMRKESMYDIMWLLLIYSLAIQLQMPTVAILYIVLSIELFLMCNENVVFFPVVASYSRRKKKFPYSTVLLPYLTVLLPFFNRTYALLPAYFRRTITAPANVL